MNVHHLELFYYVAKYEGITAAVKKMPYGIQQPAVSGQVLQLEEALGVKLFNRRPFALTPEGEALYDYVYPFFSRMADVEANLKGELQHHLRICASASVLRNHLPDVLERLKIKFPQLRLSLKEVEPSTIYTNLMNQKADIAVSVLNGNLSEGMKSVELLSLPMVLLVPATIKVKGLDDLLEENPEGEGRVARIPLVGMPPHEYLQQMFHSHLGKLGVQWDVSVEVNSLDVIESYVSRGFGAGISVKIPGMDRELDGCNVIPLDGFPPLVIGALYQGSLKPIAQEFLDATTAYAAKLTQNFK